VRAHGRSYYMAGLLAVISAAGALSCRDRAEPTAESPISLAVGEIPPDPTGLKRPGEEAFVELARTAPSHAGWILENKGHSLLLFLKDPAQSGTATSALRSMWGRDHQGRGRLAPPVPEVRTQAVTYSFLELREWRNLLLVRGVMGQPGVRKLDLAEQTNRILIGLQSEQYRGSLMRFATQAGVPAQAMDFEVTGDWIFTQGSQPTLRSTVRPLQAGLQIRRQTSATTEQTCTLGATGWMGEIDTLPVFITASHCGPRPMARDSVQWFQNAFSPTTALDSANARIGHEIADSAGFACLKHQICSYADVAVNKLTTTNWVLALVARPILGCSGACNVNDYHYWTIDTVDPKYVFDAVHSTQFAVNENVSEIGAVTGWMGGSVSNACVDITQDNTYVYPCQVEMQDTPSDLGDSGGPILVNPFNPRQDSTVMLGGIIMAKGKVQNQRKSYFTPWANIALQYPKLRVF
jgi:hypothetical protein